MPFASVDTAFLLNLEQGSRLELECYERLTAIGLRVKFVPVISHELIAVSLQKDRFGAIAGSFLAKLHLYPVSRAELSGCNLDYAKNAATDILGKYPSWAGNLAHFVAESSCLEDSFIISGNSSIKSSTWDSVQNILVANHLHRIRRFSVAGYLKTPTGVSGYSQPKIENAKKS